MSHQELEQKWRDYLFLTDEMDKFLKQHDLDMFFSLLDQRGVLQQQIEKIPEQTFYAADGGKTLLQQIKLRNNEILRNFHMVFNAMKQRENVAQQYEGKINFSGNYLNKST